MYLSNLGKSPLAPKHLAQGLAAIVLVLALVLLLVVARVWAAPEVWYLNSTPGAACGPGDQEALSQSAGSSPKTKVLDGTGDTWGRTQVSSSTIESGDWQVTFNATTDSGGGPPNRVTVLIEIRDAACSVQQTITNEAVVLSKGSTQEYTTSPVNPGQVAVAAGQIVTVSFTQTNGNQTITLRYDDDAGTDSDSRLTQPDEALILPGSDVLALGESFVTAFGGTDNPAVEESVSASLRASRSESIGFSESVSYEVVDNSPVKPEPVEPEPVEPEPVEPEPVEIESTLQDDANDDNDDDDEPDRNERESPEERIEEKEKVETRPEYIPEYIEEVRTPSLVSDAVGPLEANLVRVFHFDQLKNEWTFFDPRTEFDEVNTLKQFVPGEIYWLKCEHAQAVNLNGAQRHHLNEGWNQVLW